ncbi:MAG: bifunctional glutamate N-acetyltransferase/amino-acid acetyltransferase ArgJ [Myxococcota bacterium]|nr:bifunctional glutamate N-acetyltransferase/amino-acid acetyltransferase ArgJ [Myxococcota bacterium]
MTRALDIPPFAPGPRIPGGGFLTVPGTQGGTAAADVKGNRDARADIAVFVAPGTAGAVTTRSTAASASCRWTRARVPGPVHAVVVNAGNANAATGARGDEDNRSMAAAAAGVLGCPPDEILVCSTGVIGVPMPMQRVLPGIRTAAETLDATDAELARAILTTDLVPKQSAVERGGITVGGVAKGSGMIHPGMATMLCFLATDARIDGASLQQLVGSIADQTFNQITVDGDMSTSDTFIVQATGAGPKVRPGTQAWSDLEAALLAVAGDLAMAIARDGEGATCLITCTVEGGGDDTVARRAARAVAGSSLVKAAIHGRDANWGRVVGALGQAGLPQLDALDVDFAGTPVLRGGRPLPFDETAVTEALRAPDVSIACRVPGAGRGRAWGCDMSADYVRINADYRS